MPKTLRVTQVRGTFVYEGKAYGPFQATSEKPYLEVPEAVAYASGAPEYDGTDAHAPAPAQNVTGTPLPEDFPARALLIENGFDTLEAVRDGLVVAEGETESPIRKIDGIGAKTEAEIQAAYDKAVPTA